eukprot:326351_1
MESMNKDETTEKKEENDTVAETKIYDNINADWYQQLWSNRKSAVDLYFLKLKERESNLIQELSASICIQKYFRMFQSRSKFNVLNNAAIQIQRIFRGYMAKNYVKYEVRIKYKLHQQQLFYDQMATLIQKCYRGHLSRKNILNFYARKNYIKQLTIKSNNLLQELRDQYEQNIETQKRMEEIKKAEQFDKLIGNLHHLVSTKATHGVFRSPFGREFSATAYGISVEQHIQQKFHHQFESQYYSHSKYRRKKKQLTQ